MLRPNSARRRILLASVSLVMAATTTLRQDVIARAPSGQHWVGSWATAPQGVAGMP